VECELIDGSAAEEQPQLLMKLRADGKHLEAVERLFGPILVARRFSDRDKLGSLRRLRDSAKVLNGEQLDKAAALVLALQFRTIKPERIAEAIERVRQYGTRVFVDPGTAQWEAWQKFFLVNDPVQAKTMRKYGRWQVSAPWPPGHKPASYEAGQPMEMVA
jgi:hypothetical protein